MSIGYSDIWVGGGVDQGWIGTVLPKVLLRWVPSRLSPLASAAVIAAAAAAAAADAGGGGNNNNNNNNNNAFLGLIHMRHQTAHRWKHNS